MTPAQMLLTPLIVMFVFAMWHDHDKYETFPPWIGKVLFFFVVLPSAAGSFSLINRVERETGVIEIALLGRSGDILVDTLFTLSLVFLFGFGIVGELKSLYINKFYVGIYLYMFTLLMITMWGPDFL